MARKSKTFFLLFTQFSLNRPWGRFSLLSAISVNCLFSFVRDSFCVFVKSFIIPNNKCCNSNWSIAKKCLGKSYKRTLFSDFALLAHMLSKIVPQKDNKYFVVFYTFFHKQFNYFFFYILHWWFYLHRSRDSVYSVCGICKQTQCSQACSTNNFVIHSLTD